MYAHDIAESLITEVSQKYPMLRTDRLTTMALLRACDLLATIYSTNPTEASGELPGEDGPVFEGELYPITSEARSEALSRSDSGESNVTCPNCETRNVYHPNKYRVYECSNCGYYELG